MIKDIKPNRTTKVDKFWNNYTIHPAKRINSGKITLEQHMKKIFEMNTFYKELMEMYGNHDNENILVFGCGPCYDIIGFSRESNPKKIIGIDISLKALKFGVDNIKKTGVDKSKIELIRTGDSMDYIPLPDSSVDYIFTEGTIHHPTHKENIWIKEFYRVLKPGCFAMVEVHNRKSLYFHLYTSFIIPYVKNEMRNMKDIERMSKCTDGPNCPISRSHVPDDFVDMCNSIGFESEFKGGYLSVRDTKEYINKYKKLALKSNISENHKNFIRQVKIINGYPYYRDKLCGVGAVFKLYKR